MSRVSARSGPVQLLPPTTPPAVSVVIPLYNEVEAVPHLARELTDALEALGRTWEAVRRPRMKVGKRLPVVLSKAEIQELLSALKRPSGPQDNDAGGMGGFF